MWVFQGHQLPLSWGGKRLQALTSSSWKGKKYNLFYCGLILCERSFSPFIILGPCRLSSRLLPRPFVKKDLLLDVTAFAAAPKSILTWFVVPVQSACWTSTGAFYLMYSFTSWSLGVVSLHNLSAICKDLALCTSEGFFWACFEEFLIAAQVSPFSVNPRWTLNTKGSARRTGFSVLARAVSRVPFPVVP